MMPKLLQILGALIPRDIKRQGEAAIAAHIVGNKRDELLVVYDTQRAAGATEQEAMLVACRYLITSTL